MFSDYLELNANNMLVSSIRNCELRNIERLMYMTTLLLNQISTYIITKRKPFDFISTFINMMVLFEDIVKNSDLAYEDSSALMLVALMTAFDQSKEFRTEFKDSKLAEALRHLTCTDGSKCIWLSCNQSSCSNDSSGTYSETREALKQVLNEFISRYNQIISNKI